MRNFIEKLKVAAPDVSDSLLIIGLSSLFWGIYQMHQPAAFIVCGGLVIWFGYLQAMPQKPKG